VRSSRRTVPLRRQLLLRQLRKYRSENTIQVVARFTISGHEFELGRRDIEECLTGLLPDPVHEHYVVVRGRRFPPKQVLACATGVDRADFTTHQARRILRRLGFVAARRATEREADGERGGTGPRGGNQADALRPYVGKWVALAGPTEVLVAADSPQEVLAWLARHERRAPYGMFRVPVSPAHAEGAAPA
jgi:hypothetical protein